MSVLIKGWTMPKNCTTCRFTTSSEYCSCLLTGKFNYHKYWNCEKLDECPLVEVKTPHGDLIDRDVFRREWNLGTNCKDCNVDQKSCEYDRIYSKMDFCGWLDDDDVPVVIRAESEP